MIIKNCTITCVKFSKERFMLSFMKLLYVFTLLYPLNGVIIGIGSVGPLGLIRIGGAICLGVNRIGFIIGEDDN